MQQLPELLKAAADVPGGFWVAIYIKERGAAVKMGKNKLTQRGLRWLSRPLKWLAKPLGRLSKPLAKIEGIERPAVYLGLALLLWRVWAEQRSSAETRPPSDRRPRQRARRPSLRLLVQERLHRAALDRSEEREPRVGL